MTLFRVFLLVIILFFHVHGLALGRTQATGTSASTDGSWMDDFLQDLLTGPSQSEGKHNAETSPPGRTEANTPSEATTDDGAVVRESDPLPSETEPTAATLSLTEKIPSEGAVRTEKSDPIGRRKKTFPATTALPIPFIKPSPQRQTPAPPLVVDKLKTTAASQLIYEKLRTTTPTTVTPTTTTIAPVPEVVKDIFVVNKTTADAVRKHCRYVIPLMHYRPNKRVQERLHFILRSVKDRIRRMAKFHGQKSKKRHKGRKYTIVKVFQHFDINEDGKITMDEMANMLEFWGMIKGRRRYKSRTAGKRKGSKRNSPL